VNYKAGFSGMRWVITFYCHGGGSGVNARERYQGQNGGVFGMDGMFTSGGQEKVFVEKRGKEFMHVKAVALVPMCHYFSNGELYGASGDKPLLAD
jgi:hypothetical protein